MLITAQSELTWDQKNAVSKLKLRVSGKRKVLLLSLRP